MRKQLAFVCSPGCHTCVHNFTYIASSGIVQVSHTLYLPNMLRFETNQDCNMEQEAAFMSFVKC